MVPFSSSSGGLTVDQTAPSAMSISERQPDEYLMHVISKRKSSQWYRISTGSASNPINLPLSGPRIWMRNLWQKLRLQVRKDPCTWCKGCEPDRAKPRSVPYCVGDCLPQARFAVVGLRPPRNTCMICLANHARCKCDGRFIVPPSPGQVVSRVRQACIHFEPQQLHARFRPP